MKPIPLEYGNYYHIYNRGNNRQNIFLEERNFHYFLNLYAEHIGPMSDTFAYCLLHNHFHFLVRIKHLEEIEADDDQTLRVSETLRGSSDGVSSDKIASPSQQFGNFLNAYTKGMNKTYKRTGSVFENPFGRTEVTSEEYFVHLITYIHQNPQKHGLVADFRTWPYSSYHALLSTKPTRLKREIVLSWFGGPANLEATHRQKIMAHPLAPEDFD
jgi:REP element-mobilizing transposase RayT